MDRFINKCFDSWEHNKEEKGKDVGGQQQEDERQQSTMASSSRRYSVEINTHDNHDEERGDMKSSSSAASRKKSFTSLTPDQSVRRQRRDEKDELQDLAVKSTEEKSRRDKRQQQDSVLRQDTTTIPSMPTTSYCHLDVDRQAATPSPTKSETSNGTASTTTTSTSIEDEPYMPDEEGYVPLDKPRHFSSMPFGHARTWSAISVCFLGLILAIFSKHSLTFVKLDTPLEVSPDVHGITEVGLVRMTVCYNTDYVGTGGEEEMLSAPYWNGDVEESAHEEPCFVVRLESSIIDDTMWEVARIFTSLAIALGVFFIIMLLSTTRWESINFKPIVVGLLITYIFQSLSFFFYDTELCQEHGCTLGGGTWMGILASFCWFSAAMIAVSMDVYRTRKMRGLARRERRRQRRLRRRMKQKSRTATETTKDSSSEAVSRTRSGSLPPIPWERTAELTNKPIYTKEGLLWVI